MGIPLSTGFALMEEGTQILKITKADYKEEFGKLNLTMENVQGRKHFENFMLIDKSGETNDKAISALSALARSATHDPSLSEVEPSDLVGCFLKGEISYREYTDKDGKPKKTTQKEPGTYWEECTAEEEAWYKQNKVVKTPAPAKAEPPKETAPTPAPAPTTKAGDIDLDALLR